MASKNIGLYDTASIADGDSLIGIDVSDTTDDASGTLKQFTGTLSTGWIPNLAASKITTEQLALARGGTNADLSATGGSGQVLKQLSAGAAITVSTLAFADLASKPTTLSGYGITDAQALDSDLTAIAALSSTGILVRTALNTWAQRTIAGTSNRLTVTNGDGVSANPTLDISSSYVGQNTITTLGTIATGVWQGTLIGPTYGGTGVNNGSNLLTIPATGIAALLGTANIFTVAQTDQRDGIGTTSTDGIILTNATAAAAGAQQYSPRLRFTGQGWKTTSTAASQTVDWVIENQPVQGAASPSANFILSSQINAGGYTTRASFTSSGVLFLAASASYRFNSATGPGLGNSGNDLLFVDGSNPTNGSMRLLNSSALSVRSGMQYGWSSAGVENAANDTALARNAAGIVEINNGTAGQWGKLLAGVRDTQLSSIVDAFKLGHQISSGTVLSGHGIGILFNLATNNGGVPVQDQSAGRLTFEWGVAATNGSQDGLGKLSAFYNTTERVAIKWGANSTVPLLGFFDATAVAQQSVGAAATDAATTQTLANNLRTALINLGLAAT